VLSLSQSFPGPLHWLKINEGIEYKDVSVTYKVLTTSQPDYMHNLISVQSIRVEPALHLLLSLLDQLHLPHYKSQTAI